MNFLKTMSLLAALTALFMGIGYLIGGSTGMVIALGIAVVMNVYAYWNSDKLALSMHGAEPVSAATAPKLTEMVQRLAAEARIPTPKVFLINSAQPNAFATGRSPRKGTVAVTSGLLRLLSQDEIEGVIAHEIAHIRNRDTLTMTIVATFAGAISMLSQFAMFFRNGQRSGLFGVIGVLLAAIFAPFAAALIQMMISRTREYSADRYAAEISGKPRSLVSALRKISKGAAQIAMPSAEQHPTTAHMFITNPLTGRGIDNLFSTHPNVENRIAALEEIADQLPASTTVRRR